MPATLTLSVAGVVPAIGMMKMTDQPKTSPTLAELRAAAMQAYADHERDMATDPSYRKAVKADQARRVRAQKLLDR